MSSTVILVYITAPESAAEALSEGLVTERLAACVNRITGVKSTYTWNGQVCRDDETLLLCKTTRARLEELVDYVRMKHPYEVPGITAIDICGGHNGFLAWVQESVKP